MTTTTAAGSALSDGAAPSLVLESLRWRPDSLVTNHDGETVWLKSMVQGEVRGVTDCCPAEYPCDRHRPVPVHNGWGACKHGNGFPCPICMGVPAGHRR